MGSESSLDVEISGDVGGDWFLSSLVNFTSSTRIGVGGLNGAR